LANLSSKTFAASLVFRNYQASGLVAISTNLGVTMNLGAGNFTTGSYWDIKKGVPCDLNGEVKSQDNKRVRCVLDWYKDNPKRAISLFMYKSIYYWSPWVGPLAEGTSGRNPWLRYGPLSFLTDKEFTMEIVEGSLGKLISALWEFLSIVLLFIGFIRIYKLGNLEKNLAVISMILILTNWAICLLTIGDNRFRLPILGVSTFIQVAGIHFLWKDKLLKSQRRILY
jgi:hypothetical protein